jgi:hypothetical protein
MHEVDAPAAPFATFLGVKPMIILGPPEMQREESPANFPGESDEVRGKQFSTHGVAMTRRR